MSQSYWLTNVRLENGFTYNENETITGTETGNYHIKIESGKISSILSAKESITDQVPQHDVHGLLMVPSFKEMHIHIDKTYYGGPWKACMPAINGVKTRIEEEQVLLPELLPTAKVRAEKMLDLLLDFGSTHIRTHCNIDPVIGLKNLEATIQALEGYKDKLTYEIVAFPQHGLLRSNSVGLVRDAMKNGANLVGGVDPATIDENIERSLETIMDIAVEYNSDIDVHLHDPDHLGLFTMQRLASMTEDAGWQGRVTVSHASGLADLSVPEATGIAERFSETGISITSTVPIFRTIPIPLLHEKGVKVELGNDSITDHWTPFGIGDNLEKAGRLAERFRMIDERSLAKSLRFITGGKTLLNQDGVKTWPNVGDEANIVLLEASCSAEAVARRAKRAAVIFRGNVVSGSISSFETTDV
ncbi:amidohydrolase family protein [Peribacillus frigoritolerans]|uniref:amidohydrolase family protein n=1 Tax=Peribacillus frigoritolerans TaxID=450367 RepID=UPI000FD77441|nr:amidohydrolase family protein [Peribacillus frigoritolerans]AZV62769.1 deaminase [Peribacillus frigoritolerans]